MDASGASALLSYGGRSKGAVIFARLKIYMQVNSSNLDFGN